MMYLAIFYTDVFLLPPAAMALLFLACRIWDGVNDPIMGMIADSTRSRWGRFRPYILFAPVPGLVFTCLTFYVPDMSTTGKIVWAFATYIPMQMIKTVMVVPYYSIMPLITTDPKVRTQISAVQQIFVTLTMLMVSMVAISIVAAFSNQQEGYFFAALFFGFIAVLALWITFFVNREIRFSRQPDTRQSPFKQRF